MADRRVQTAYEFRVKSFPDIYATDALHFNFRRRQILLHWSISACTAMALHTMASNIPRVLIAWAWHAEVLDIGTRQVVRDELGMCLRHRNFSRPR